MALGRSEMRQSRSGVGGATVNTWIGLLELQYKKGRMGPLTNEFEL